MELILSEMGWSTNYRQKITTKGMEKSRQDGNKQINILLRMNNG